MFEVGFTEIVLIFGIALLVLGPARLPKLAADLGRWAGRARSMARQLRTQLEQEVHFDPLATDTPKASTHGAAPTTIHAPSTPLSSPVAPGAVDTARATPLQSAGDRPALPDEAESAPMTATASIDPAAAAAASTTPRQDGH